MLSTMAATASILQIASQVALILTLGVVIWYTAETHLLRRLQVRPALILTLNLSGNELFIRNVGSSAALNVEIPNFKGIQLMISASPDWLDFLTVNGQQTIMLCSQATNWVGMDYTVVLAKGPLRILLRYQDIDGHSYETQTEVTSKGTKILYTRRIGFWSKLFKKVRRNP
ncbi:MAG TPA: hypothetical protein VNM47_09110 [Terriglobia bacterium]|nr:hypothetical protein [Terriglobia bacterium]